MLKLASYIGSYVSGASVRCELAIAVAFLRVDLVLSVELEEWRKINSLSM